MAYQVHGAELRRLRQFDRVWRIRTRLPERFGERCRITARGRLNSVRVEFQDGFWAVTSRWSVRLA